MKRRILTAVLIITVLSGLTGCSGSDIQSSNEVTMYLWDKSMCKELTPWLEEQFPEIKFNFVVGNNSIDYYNYLQEHGELPDIITCRRFSLNDAAELSEHLMDMSKTQLAGTFYSSYIGNNRDSSGAIKWLPMCAEVDGIIANRDLFKKYGVSMPENYEEFVRVCSFFEEKGITGFANDYNQDYSCLEAMQGSAIPELMSPEGTRWREEYESEKEDGSVGLDEQVWPVVFEKFEQFLIDTCVKPEDLNLLFNTEKQLYLDGKVAMVRGTVNDCIVLKSENGIDSVMLPYFGQTREDNWLLTYPIYQIAVNKDVEDDPQKREVIMEILDAVFSTEGQKRAAAGSNVLTYNKTVEMSLPDSMEYVEECVEKNHLYQRLASTEFFAISMKVTENIINGKYGAEGAYKDFDAQLKAPEEPAEEDIVAVMEKGYDHNFTVHGSQAASAVANTMRNYLNTDVLIGYSSIISSSVYKGGYTAQQLNWLMCGRATVRKAELTGEQITEVMDWLVNVKEDGDNPIRHHTLIPVVSGMEYTIRDNEDGIYTLKDVTMNGKAIDEQAVYTVTLMGDDNFIEAEIFCGCPMPENIRTALKPVDQVPAAILTEALTDGAQLEVPTKYVTIRK